VLPLVAAPQEAGEALFVPSCWHHVVANTADTLSINHNWLNAHCLHWVWGYMRAQYLEAAELIEDCRCVWDGGLQPGAAAPAGCSQLLSKAPPISWPGITCALVRRRPLCSAAEFEALVQRNLEANAGLGLQQVLEMLEAALLRDATSCPGQAVNERAAGGCEAAAAAHDDADSCWNCCRRSCCCWRSAPRASTLR
jgi:hypothetical protein